MECKDEKMEDMGRETRRKAYRCSFGRPSTVSPRADPKDGKLVPKCGSPCGEARRQAQVTRRGVDMNRHVLWMGTKQRLVRVCVLLVWLAVLFLVYIWTRSGFGIFFWSVSSCAFFFVFSFLYLSSRFLSSYPFQPVLKSAIATTCTKTPRRARRITSTFQTNRHKNRIAGLSNHGCHSIRAHPRVHGRCGPGASGSRMLGSPMV